MKKSATTKAPKKNEQDVIDLAPKKEQNVNGGLNFVAVLSKHTPK